MRIDKFLKVSRIIKRRTVADKACSSDRILVNDKIAKSSTKVKIGDKITVIFGNKTVNYKVLDIVDTSNKVLANKLVEVIDG